MILAHQLEKTIANFLLFSEADAALMAAAGPGGEASGQSVLPGTTHGEKTAPNIVCLVTPGPETIQFTGNSAMGCTVQVKSNIVTTEAQPDPTAAHTALCANVSDALASSTLESDLIARARVLGLTCTVFLVHSRQAGATEVDQDCYVTTFTFTAEACEADVT